MGNPKAAAGISDYVFAGTIEEYMGVKEQKPDDSRMPFSVYKVKVQRNMKGELKEDVIVQNPGGITSDGTLIVDEGAALPEVGKNYVFCGTAARDGGICLFGKGGFEEIPDSATSSQSSKKSKGNIEKSKTYLKYLDGCQNQERPKEAGKEEKSKLFDGGK